jgi:hypothetical protein
MQPPGTYHQIEPFGWCVRKPDAHRVIVLFNVRNRVAEDRSYPSLQGLIDEPGEIAAQYAQKAVLENLAKGPHFEAAAPAALGILDAHLLNPVPLALQSGQQPHFLGEIESQPPEVDDIAAATQSRCSLDQYGLKAVA